MDQDGANFDEVGQSLYSSLIMAYTATQGWTRWNAN